MHKALYNLFWPDYLHLTVYNPSRNLRSNTGVQVEIPLICNTFQGQAAILFNKLPIDIRNTADHDVFSREVLTSLLKRLKTFFNEESLQNQVNLPIV